MVYFLLSIDLGYFLFLPTSDQLGRGKNQTVYMAEDHFRIYINFSILHNVIICMNEFKENDLSLLNYLCDVLINKNPTYESINNTSKIYLL